MATKNHGEHSFGGGDAVEYAEPTDDSEIEEYEDAEPKGPSERWTHWQTEVKASLTAEDRWRKEGVEAEKSYFGDDEKDYMSSDYQKDEHKTNIIHANIEVLKPLVYSETPDPIVRRRFADGGDNDPTDRIAAMVAQRLGVFMVDTSNFDRAMELARDDWLVPGRGLARVFYEAEFSNQPVIDQASGQPVVDSETGQPFMQEVKSSEEVVIRHWPWQRCLFSASNSWDEVRWVGFEHPMTKMKVKKRFGEEIADATDYPINGLKGTSTLSSSEKTGWEPDSDEETSRSPSVTAHDQCIVLEIWSKESGKVIWWSPHYREDVMDEIDDPLNLDNFFNFPMPLLATSKAGMLTPRPDTAYYRQRAEEIDIATRKLRSILNAISVSGAYPGAMSEEIKKLLKGDNIMVAIQEWVAYLEKGGTTGIIQWIPIEQFIKAAQALHAMREQAKQQLYEISGISDIVRGQSDPNETLGAQQIKGNYANLRLRDKQQKMGRFARDAIAIMVEVAVEHFDTQTIADIVNIKLPMTDMELQALVQQVDLVKQQYAMQAQVAQAMKQPPPPEPNIPFFERTSWERVHGLLRDDMQRKFTLNIETDATILGDQEEDKKQRVEFLQAFSAMAESLFPMAQSGVVEMKVIKELMLFAVRGFPKSRTLEGMLESLPEKYEQKPKEDPSVTVAKIKSETDKMIKAMEIQNDASLALGEQSHDMRMKGAEIIADGFMKQMEGQQRE